MKALVFGLFLGACCVAPISAQTSDDPNVEPGEGDFYSLQDSRLVFAPTGTGLGKDALYINAMFPGYADIQFGFTDQFSAGFGTFWFALFTVNGKYSWQLNESTDLSVGALGIRTGMVKTNWTGIGYGSLTKRRGRTQWTYSVGVGGNGNDGSFDTVLLQVVGWQRMLGPRVTLVSENWIASGFSIANQRIYDEPGTIENDAFYPVPVYPENSRDISLRGWVVAPSLGFRLVSPRNEDRAWFFGAIFPTVFSGEVNEQSWEWSYDREEWVLEDVVAESDYAGVPLPFISLVWKIGNVNTY